MPLGGYRGALILLQVHRSDIRQLIDAIVVTLVMLLRLIYCRFIIIIIISSSSSSSSRPIDRFATTAARYLYFVL